MDITTMNTLAKACRGRKLDHTNTHVWYAFPSETALLKFRYQIPFLTLWGGQSGVPSLPECLTVYLAEIRDYEPYQATQG